MQVIPDPALVVLIGPSGAGKSTWARAHYRDEEIVSSDRLRAMVGSGEHDLEASAAAFALLDEIVAARLARRLTTVVDTLGFDDERRRRHLALARQHDLPGVAVVFAESPEVCRARNRARTRPVPAAALTAQLRRMEEIRVETDGWDLVLRPEPSHVSVVPALVEERYEERTGNFYLQLSRFPAQEPLAVWLREMAQEAERVGFAGLAVMDHLVQIPQVGREWEPLPEAYTTLAFLASMTRRLRLGCLVTNTAFRNPALLAKLVATLDVITEGRAFCGLGAGWYEHELASYGFAPPGDRFHRLEDTIAILRRMWAPGKATYDGPSYSVHEAVSYPRPLHPIPIIVGGNGLRTRRLAIRLADGINLIGLRPAELMLEEVQGGLKEAGRTDDFEVSVLDTPLVGRTRSDVADRVERARGNRSAAVFATAHRAATAMDHVATYRRLLAQGVHAVFVAPVGLEHPDDVTLWEPIVAELREG